LKKFILALVALAAFAPFIGAVSFTPSTPSVSAGAGDLRVSVACSPLTSSQSAVPGDSQLCRTRIRNGGAYPITGIEVSRPTPNTITDRYSYGYIPLTCDLAGCDPFTLNPGQTAYIFEESTFNPYQDGRGKTKATATGTQVIERVGKPTLYITVTGSGTEQKSLP
jgi:hypothetical protein